MLQKADWSSIQYLIQDLDLHSDERGNLFEALRFSRQGIPTGGQIYVYTINSGQRRGDHFHRKKGEWFLCASGAARLLMKTSDGHLVNQILDGRSPQLVYAGPGTTHALLNENNEPALIVAYGSKEFDPEDPDTFMMQAD